MGEERRGRRPIVMLLSSRLATAAAASVITALVVGGVAAATSDTARHPGRAQTANATTQILGGSVPFVDVADLTSFVGLNGQAHATALVGSSAWFLPVGGTLSAFGARLDALAGGNVTFTVYKNGAATAVTCTIAYPDKKCPPAAGTVSFVAGDAVAVKIVNSSGGALNNVRWTALYVIPD
jgi:hypothetical protein